MNSRMSVTFHFRGQTSEISLFSFTLALFFSPDITYTGSGGVDALVEQVVKEKRRLAGQRNFRCVDIVLVETSQELRKVRPSVGNQLQADDLNNQRQRQPSVDGRCFVAADLLDR